MLPDWIELCKLFSEHGAEYLIVGGQAVIAHGYPRLTKDMDLLVRPTADNGARVLSALAEFGALRQVVLGLVLRARRYHLAGAQLLRWGAGGIFPPCPMVF